MTLIIGLKYKDGVALIGDTKITDGPNSSHHEKKIVAPLEGFKIAVGSAGFTQLAKEFNTKINLLVQQRLAEYRLLNVKTLSGTGIDLKDIESGKNKDFDLPYIYSYIQFLDDCAFLTKQLADVGKVYGPNPIESLVALYNGNEGVLYRIDCNGFKIEVPYSSIGSGTYNIGDYIRENYKPKMSLYEAVLLGTFLIKFVEMLKFDVNKFVGLEEGKLPQIFIITQSKCENYTFSSADTIKILKDAKTRVEEMNKALILFPDIKNKIESPISSTAKERMY